MFCPNCGTEQLQGTTFCSVCGAELPKIPESSENVAKLLPPNNLPNPNLNKNKAQFIPNQSMPNQMVNPNMGMQQMPYPNQMMNPNMGMQQMQYPNQMMNPNMGMQQMPYPNQMMNPNMGMQQMPYPNQYPHPMPNQQININIMNHNEPKKSSKNKFIAAGLAFFLGTFGFHKFYLGKSGWGLLYFLACWTGIPSFISLIESIMYLCTSDEDWNRKY